MFTKMFPELHVSDVDKTAKFLVDALGFKVDHSFEDEGVVDFAILKHGDLTLYLHHMLPDEESDRPKRMRLYIELTDIESLHTELVKGGFPVSEIEHQSYGSGAKTCLLTAPDGYEIWLQQWM